MSDDFAFAEEDYNDPFGGYDGGYTDNNYGEDDYGEDDYGEDDYGEDDYQYSAEDVYGEDIPQEYVEEQQFETEMGAFGEGGRVTFKPTAGDMQVTLTEGGLISLSQAIGRDIKDPTNRFREIVDAVCRNLQLEEAIIISLVNKVIYLKNIEYINPVGYIFGYIATDGGKSMKKSAIDVIFSEISTPKIQNLNAGMEPPDVIRYARFWMDLRKRMN